MSEFTETPPVLLTDNDIDAALATVLPRVYEGAVNRDREGAVPFEALRAVAQSGLLGLSIPASHGGSGASAVTICRVLRQLAAADPSVAQTFEPHLGAIDVVNVAGSGDQRKRLFATVTGGAWIGNATNERHRPQGAENYETQIIPAGAGHNGLRLSGRKYYCTGALTADLIAVMARFGDQGTVAVWVPRTAPGVTVIEDWDAFGQRGTASGTVLLENVHVDEADILARGKIFERPQVHGAYTQLHHAALDLGILDAVISDAADYVRTRSRPAAGSPYAGNTEDPIVIRAFGEFSVQRAAASTLLKHAAETYDRLEAVVRTAAPDRAREAATEVSLAIASAKVFISRTTIDTASAVFEFCGAGATSIRLGLDRHWRNARTHSLHDASRWKFHHIGNHLLNGAHPPGSGII